MRRVITQGRIIWWVVMKHAVRFRGSKMWNTSVKNVTGTNKNFKSINHVKINKLTSVAYVLTEEYYKLILTLINSSFVIFYNKVFWSLGWLIINHLQVICLHHVRLIPIEVNDHQRIVIWWEHIRLALHSQHTIQRWDEPAVRHQQDSFTFLLMGHLS